MAWCMEATLHGLVYRGNQAASKCFEGSCIPAGAFAAASSEARAVLSGQGPVLQAVAPAAAALGSCCTLVLLHQQVRSSCCCWAVCKST